MADEPTPTIAPNPVHRKKTYALIGSVIGFVALMCAFLSPWIAKAIDPPPPPVEVSVVDFAAKLKAAAEAKLSGQTYVGTPVKSKPSDYLPPVVIAVGLIGAGFGVLSLFMHEPKAFAACAVGLGVAAAVVQWSILLVVAIALIILVTIVLTVLNGL